jgi:hypothetical protein
MTSYSKPTPEQVDRAVALLASPQHCRVFFTKLENPEWVALLREKGCFKHPPEPVKSGEGVVHPSWPASYYLARMAAHAPEEVFEALKDIKTSNARVIADICDAAIAMPEERAEALSATILDAVKARVWVELYAGEVADLMVKLAGDGQLDAALRLADALFLLKPRKSIGHEPLGIIDPYSYGELLRKVIGPFGKVDAVRAMEWSCELLGKAASFHLSPDSRDQFDDVSPIWRPLVESPRWEHGSDVADCIVTAVRELSEEVIRDGLWLLSDAVEFLEGKGKLILARLALHLVRVFAERDAELARRRMLDRELFDDYRYRHEYAMLLKERFGMLRPEEQRTILSWIEEGPDREETRRLLKANLGDEFKEEYVERRVRAWQRDRLSWFSQSLPSDWRVRYEALVAELGSPEHADVVFWCETGWGGGQPPRTAAQLAAMDTPALVEFLKTWRPDSKDFMGPSVADMANEFAAAVRENLDRFSTEAPAFADLHPTYVTRLLGEIATALQNEREVACEPVVDLCLAVVSHPVELRQEERVQGVPLDSDPSWEYARNEVATLIARLCDHNVPLRLREKIWQCLSALKDMPDKSYIVGEPNEDIRLATWLDHACNNPKAKWVHALIRYAIWVKKETIGEAGEAETGLGMAQVPEAAKLLNKYLLPECPSSPAIRSEYGQSFPALCWLDQAWAEQHAAAIFTLSGDHGQHGWAAWNSYLVANRVYDRVFHMLEGVYSHAVDALDRTLETANARFNPLHRLAEHLIVLCGRGVLTVDQPDGLLCRFFRNAPADVRAHAIKTVGRSLHGAEQLPEGLVERFVRLWEWLWPCLTASGNEPAKDELSAFGWWLTCGKFGDDWCLDQLLQVTTLQPALQPESNVMEKLASLATNYPAKAATCADRMVRGDRDRWRLSGWQTALTVLLQAALSSSEPVAQATARRLIEHLGRRGFLDFGKLLNGNCRPT